MNKDDRVYYKKLHRRDKSSKKWKHKKKRTYRQRKGWYKGYWCDSSWELAFVIYNLEHDIPFERNKKGFPYIYYKKQHLFYPDFIVDGKYVEIKGVMTKKNKAKIAAFPEPITILMEKEMQKYLSYVKSKYGKGFAKLYEKNKLKKYKKKKQDKKKKGRGKK